jgi:hypothetical protein
MSEYRHENIQFRVWWIPQIPMASFFYSVPTLDAGLLLIDALAKYDLFQLANNIKPDYSNAGGVAWKTSLTEGEWWDIDDEDAIAEVREAISRLESVS